MLEGCFTACCRRVSWASFPAMRHKDTLSGHRTCGNAFPAHLCQAEGHVHMHTVLQEAFLPLLWDGQHKGAPCSRGIIKQQLILSHAKTGMEQTRAALLVWRILHGLVRPERCCACDALPRGVWPAEKPLCAINSV